MVAQIKVNDLAKLKYDRLHEDYGVLEDQYENLASDVDRLKRKHRNELNELDLKLSEKEAENRELNLWITELNEKTRTSSITTKIEAEKEELEQAIRHLKTSFDKRMKMQTMRQSDLQKRCDDVENQNKDLKCKLMKSEAEVDQLKFQINELQNDLTKEKVKLEESEDRCIMLQIEKETISDLFQGTVST